MRIGEFSKRNGLNVDTVRYYVDLNLIHPLRKGKYFYFGEEQQNQLERLLFLKNLNFSLEEIKKIVSVEKFENIETAKPSQLYNKMLLEKLNNVEEEIRHLTKVKKLLNQEIQSSEKTELPMVNPNGLQFNDLSFLTCPHCQKPIELQNGTLKNNRINSGEGTCDCGYTLSVEEGIILTPSAHYIQVDDDSSVIDNFIDEAPKTFIDIMLKYNEEMARLLVSKGLEDKTLLFMRTGVGPVELHLLSKTTNIRLMILVEENINELKIAKKSIETNFPDCHVLYICGNLKDLPLRRNMVDIVIDFLATFTNGFTSELDLYEMTNPALKEHSSVMGLYLYFKKSDMFARIDKRKYKTFDLKAIIHKIESYQFILKEEFPEIVMHEGSNINNFFTDGDTVGSKIMIFER